jgi:hypothetical protein
VGGVLLAPVLVAPGHVHPVEGIQLSQLQRPAGEQGETHGHHHDQHGDHEEYVEFRASNPALWESGKSAPEAGG